MEALRVGDCETTVVLNVFLSSGFGKHLSSWDKPPDHHQALQNPDTKPVRRSVTQIIETHFGMRKAPARSRHPPGCTVVGTSGNTDELVPVQSEIGMRPPAFINGAELHRSFRSSQLGVKVLLL